jgi:hypothetical protein
MRIGDGEKEEGSGCEGLERRHVVEDLFCLGINLVVTFSV